MCISPKVQKLISSQDFQCEPRAMKLYKISPLVSRIKHENGYTDMTQFMYSSKRITQELSNFP